MLCLAADIYNSPVPVSHVPGGEEPSVQSPEGLDPREQATAPLALELAKEIKPGA